MAIHDVKERKINQNQNQIDNECVEDLLYWKCGCDLYVKEKEGNV
jgi:hypothetical protein